MSNFLATVHSLTSLRSWVTLIACVVGITVMCLRAFENDETRARQAERKREKDLRLLAEKIAAYGNRVHQRYPTGDVVVCERDLACQLGKRPDAVVTALNLLLVEEKVQRARLNGYWKLNA
jgi:hypothetical protein